MKYFLLSIEDGTIYDEKVIPILDRHGIKGAFFLNSGLDDFVWYNEGRPVRRARLEERVALYQNHEVGCHSLTHPHLTELSDDHIGYEVGVDKENLERIFTRPVTSFSFPFDDYDERCIARIKAIDGFTAILLPELEASFRFPKDPCHIKITAMDIHDALTKFPTFLEDKDAELFTFVCHAYDFEFGGTYGELEKLCTMVKNSGTKSVFFRDLPEVLESLHYQK